MHLLQSVDEVIAKELEGDECPELVPDSCENQKLLKSAIKYNKNTRDCIATNSTE